MVPKHLNHNTNIIPCWGFPGDSVVKNLPANAGDTGDEGLIPEMGRSPGEGNGNLLWYSCLEKPMDRGTWWATVHGVAECGTWLMGWACMQSHIKDWSSNSTANDAVLARDLFDIKLHPSVATKPFIRASLSASCLKLSVWTLLTFFFFPKLWITEMIPSGVWGTGATLAKWQNMANRSFQ